MIRGEFVCRCQPRVFCRGQVLYIRRHIIHVLDEKLMRSLRLFLIQAANLNYSALRAVSRLRRCASPRAFMVCALSRNAGKNRRHACACACRQRQCARQRFARARASGRCFALLRAAAARAARGTVACASRVTVARPPPGGMKRAA